MHITVNGKTEKIAGQMKLSDYLKGRGMAVEKVVVERNAQIVKKQDFDTTLLSAGDKLEVVCFVGGG
jgi:sulfur carrier protein